MQKDYTEQLIQQLLDRHRTKASEYGNRADTQVVDQIGVSPVLYQLARIAEKLHRVARRVDIFDEPQEGWQSAESLLVDIAGHALRTATLLKQQKTNDAIDLLQQIQDETEEVSGATESEKEESLVDEYGRDEYERKSDQFHQDKYMELQNHPERFTIREMNYITDYINNMAKRMQEQANREKEELLRSETRTKERCICPSDQEICLCGAISYPYRKDLRTEPRVQLWIDGKPIVPVR